MTDLQQHTRAEVEKEIDRIPPEYMENLLRLLRVFRESVALPSAEDSLRQGWREAMNRDTHPIEELWVGIDVE
jgi:hypothetical protein